MVSCGSLFGRTINNLPILGEISVPSLRAAHFLAPVACLVPQTHVHARPPATLSASTGKITDSRRGSCRFPFLDILGYLKNTHKNSKFGRVRRVPTRELGWNSLVGTCLTLPNLGFLWDFFKYPKISNIGNQLFFPVYTAVFSVVTQRSSREERCVVF